MIDRFNMASSPRNKRKYIYIYISFNKRAN